MTRSSSRLRTRLVPTCWLLITFAPLSGCDRKSDDAAPSTETPPEQSAEPHTPPAIEEVQLMLWKLGRRPSESDALVEYCLSRYDDPNAEVRAAVAGAMVTHYADLLGQGDVTARPELDRAVKLLFDSPVATPRQLGAAVGWVERADQIDSARSLWTKIAKRFSRSDDPDVVETSRDLVERADLRLGMLGRELELAGPLARGGRLDWASYRGKLVLVDFWATWCRPCLAEMPHLKKLYEKYHAQGFDILGVSLDNDRENETAADIVRRLLDDRDYPWKSVVFSDPKEQGMDNPIAKRYGIGGIPRGVLVGRDGKVISINALGHRLDQLLAEEMKIEDANRNE